MKTIIDKETNRSLYLFEDDKVIDADINKIEVGDPVELAIADYNSTTITIHEDVDPPTDWRGGKYFFDGTDWTLDTDYVDDPEPEKTRVVYDNYKRPRMDTGNEG